MDKTLERILSLIPKKENGDFKHGALSQFARPLGFKDGHIISDWIAGNSTSYRNYLYQISVLHNVSVEWLKGETDDSTPENKKPTVLSDDELRALDEELIRRLCELSPEELRQVDAFVQGMIANR